MYEKRDLEPLSYSASRSGLMALILSLASTLNSSSFLYCLKAIRSRDSLHVEHRRCSLEPETFKSIWSQRPPASIQMIFLVLGITK